MAEHWRSRWAIPALIAAAADGAVVVAHVTGRLPGPAWAFPVLLSVVPVLIGGLWWFGLERKPLVALVGSFGLLFALYGSYFSYQGAYLNRSLDDTAFLREVRSRVPLDQPLMINSADEALEGLRMQFYIGDTVYFLHNLSFVLDDRIKTPDVYVVTRFNRMAELEKYGKVEPLVRCEQSRRERDASDRWTLFHVHLRDDLKRKDIAKVRISPMQAMYRADGPDLAEKK